MHTKRSSKCVKLFHYVLFGKQKTSFEEPIALLTFEDDMLPKKCGMLTLTLNYYIKSKVSSYFFKEFNYNAIFNYIFDKVLLDSITYPKIFQRIFDNYSKQEIRRSIETSISNVFIKENDQSLSHLFTIHTQIFASIIVDTITHINSIKNITKREIIINKILNKI